jgi:hypothetical protein
VTRTHCAEVLDPADIATGRPAPEVKLLLIGERVDGFFVERFTRNGEFVSQTQHETMDEAMRHIYSEYDEISEWYECPDGADPLEYIRTHSSRSEPIS